MPGDEPRDVRDSLTELERRLLELERELRTGASQDAAAAGGPPPSPPPSPPAAEHPEDTGAGDVAALAGEAQQKVDALRTSLDGVADASDRLRETAQTVVEGHGRALVRLERTGLAAEGPEAAAPAARAAAAPEPPTGPPQRRALRRWPALALIGALLAGGALVAWLALRDEEEARPPRPPSGAAARVLITRGAPDVGFDGAPARSAPAAARAVCEGRAAAALVVLPAGADLPGPCALTAVAAGVVEARAVAIRTPSGGGGRTCVSAPNVDALVRARTDPTLTAARAAAARRAAAIADAAARADGLAPAGVARATRTAAARAGRAFDRDRRLRLLRVAPRRGARCEPPFGRPLRSGAYPLARRAVLLTSPAGAATPEVARAERTLRAALGGPTPIDATVLD